MSSGRKDQHVDLADAQQQDRPAHNDFDDVRFVHHALAGIDRERVSLSTAFAGIDWPVPLYVNGMTGGSARTGEINRSLAIAARETGVPIATGSMSVALRDPDMIGTFRVMRDENPGGFVMANLSADATPDDAARVVDLLQADALQVHLNSVQETVMPEGSRDFSAWPGNLAAIVERLEVPVIVKEVGFGLSRPTLERLAQLGVAVADVSGAGGTDFARIENARRAENDYAFMTGWGQSAVCSLLDAGDAAPGGIPDLVASGGVRTPLDVVRALALGAHAVGVSGVFLHAVLRGGEDALIARIGAWLEQIAQLHALLGASTPAELARTDLLLRGDVREFCELRGIDAAAFSRRGERHTGSSDEG
ncbi:type 2 isopentenyl-diphosphate Delta-isomerase [Microbacterium protaetiae]|uniref:Isopentenyl-diphosphate delta-isomerase n=1 Tax=Microbacterium protaetiae TaxID=2509458 RepID=A0A4P6EDY3_9MICO|nr:type 2 isopentenyl-diphosphate Delta-isomerase [Microbacterium protaetiae]QAY60495.1 type 2 isopentenyl-diphosphate Delta-isomerase [Microbacterium protaetiae]